MNTALISYSIPKRWVLAALAGCLLLTDAASLSARERQVNLKWGELEQVVVGRKVTMILPDAEVIEGKVQSIGPDDLIIDTNKTSNKLKYAKGKCTIPRTSVSVIRLGEVRGKWRVIGTVVGGGTGAIFGSAFYKYANNEANPDLGAKVAAGLIGGGAALGYLAGRGIDHHVLIINVVH